MNFVGALALLMVYSPFWLPIVFVILIVTRRKVTLRHLFYFLTIDCFSLGLSLLIVRFIFAELKPD